jgi:hypothetical protein
MKILKAVMLTLLISLCVAVAAVIAIQIFGGDDTERAQPRERVRNNADSNVMEVTDVVFLDSLNADPEEDNRFWQRAARISEETGLWSYFPLLPWDVLPGETAVLSVSAIGFKGWEVDPGFAYVELFDEKIEDEIAYVSFIMPEERASIAALYDEIPYINREMQKEQFMRMGDFHEFGSEPPPPSNNIEVGEQLNLYAIEQRQRSFMFILPRNLPADGRQYQGILTWIVENGDMKWDQDEPQVARPNEILHLGQLHGIPMVRGEYSFTFVIQQRFPDSTAVDGWGPWQRQSEIYYYALFVTEPNPLPMIVTPQKLPDAMIGVYYEAYIDTSFLNTQTPALIGWTWVVQSRLPDGLEFSTLGPLHTTGRIWGTVTNPTLSKDTYDLEVRINLNPPITPPHPLERTFTLYVWDRPEISEPTWPGGAVWHDGMAGHPYNLLTGATVVTDAGGNITSVTGGSIEDTNGRVTLNAPGGINLADADLPGGFAAATASWRWVEIISEEQGYVRLPDGLRFVFDSADMRKAAITGLPSEATAVGSHKVAFGVAWLNRNSINVPILPSGDPYIITTIITFDIVIHPRIAFGEAIIPDGMVGPGGPGSDAPPPPDVLAVRNPPNPDIYWSVPQPEPEERYGVRVGGTDAAPIFGARIETMNIPPEATTGVSGTPGTTAINWTHGTALPDSTLRYEDALPNSDTELKSLLYIRGHTTENAKAGDHKLKIRFEIEHNNPNIDGAYREQDFNLRIWNRAYLTVRIGTPETNRNSVPPDVARLDGNLLYRGFGRAVIPGQWGRIIAEQPANFVRWEVSGLSGLPVTRASFEAIPHFPPDYPNPGPWIGVGDNWDLSPPGLGATAGVNIRMPMPETPGDPAINVEIRGVHAAPPVITNPRPPARLSDGTVGVDYFGSFILSSSDPSVIGSGPVSREWGIIENPADPEFGRLPPGISFDPGGSGFYNPPTTTGTFSFHVGLTLPGTMRLTYGLTGINNVPFIPADGRPYSITVNHFAYSYGDVDGRDGLTLADLVLLAKFVNNPPGSPEREAARDAMGQNIRNGNIFSRHPADPGTADLRELQLWFAQEGEWDRFNRPPQPTE